MKKQEEKTFGKRLTEIEERIKKREQKTTEKVKHESK